MCQYQTLYHNTEKGYIIRCLQCNHIQLGFGNIAINFQYDEFDCFRQRMERRYAGIKQDERDNCLKNICVPTPCEGVMLLLSPKELYLLVYMLDVAETELRSQELISLFGSY